jgi:hypothetical protein
MYQDAINALSSLMDGFEEALHISVVTSNHIILAHESSVETFESDIEMVEWMEDNLTKKVN